MKYMITWNLPRETYKEAAERFLSTGAPEPDGLKTLGRWHSLDQSIGFHLVETDAPELLLQFAAEWKDVLDIRAVPVLDDAAAAGAISKAFGK